MFGGMYFGGSYFGGLPSLPELTSLPESVVGHTGALRLAGHVARLEQSTRRLAALEASRLDAGIQRLPGQGVRRL